MLCQAFTLHFTCNACNTHWRACPHTLRSDLSSLWQSVCSTSSLKTPVKSISAHRLTHTPLHTAKETEFLKCSWTHSAPGFNGGRRLGFSELRDLSPIIPEDAESSVCLHVCMTVHMCNCVNAHGWLSASHPEIVREPLSCNRSPQRRTEAERREKPQVKTWNKIFFCKER